MLASRSPLALLLLLAACAPSPTPSAPRTSPPPVAAAASASSSPAATSASADAEETLRHVDRIEHGLSLGARIDGDARLALADRMVAHHVHGLSVAVIKDFRIAWTKGYGLADVEAHAPVTDTTLFQAGSISKPVFAMAVLRKVQDGKLALESKINDVLRSWKLPDNDLTRASPVELVELLSHTGGVTVHGFPGYAAGEPRPSLLQILDGAAPANTDPLRVDLAPGTKFRYSGGGITIAQQALLDVEQKPFPQILAETVLGPVRMEHSTYEQPLPDARVPSAAAGYDGEGGPIAGKRHVYPEMAAAGLWTTPSDLARFAIELALESAGKSQKVLSQAMATRMLTKVAMVGPDTDIALGIFLDRHRGVTYFGHDGADAGFQAMLTMNAATGAGVAMMANSDNGIELMRELLGAVAAEYAWDGFDTTVKPVTLDPARLAALAGSYQVHADRVWHLAVDGDHLVMTTPFYPPAALLPISDSVFVRRDEDSRYTFSTAADGSVQLAAAPPPGDWPFAKRMPGTFTVPLDDVAAGRIDQAVQRYRAAMAKAAGDDAFAEQRFNGMGLGVMQRGDVAGAMLLFRLNVALFPDSMNAYDSLADGYVRAGDKAHALTSYRASLAAFARDKKTPASYKDELRKKAIAKIAELGAAP